MAIRFKANIQAVRLSEITLVDRARMPLTPSAAIHLEVHPHVVHLSEIALVKSAQMLNSGIQYQRMMLAESVYEKMVAAGIWTDADSKNRILPDIFNIVETFSVALARSTDDQVTIADAAFLTLSKLATDSATTTDSLSMWFGLSNADSATLAEAIAISLSHSYADYSALADTTILQVAKTKSEVTAVSDTVVHVSNFYRNFIDAVTLSEFVTVDRVIDAFNAAAAVDAHYWATSKPVEDAAVIADITKLATTRLVTDGLSSSDFSSWTYAKEPLDTALLVEVTYLSSTKMATDTSVLLDQSTLHSEKPLVENAAVSDAVVYASNFYRNFIDAVVLSELVTVERSIDAFNVATTVDTQYWATSKVVTDTVAVAELAQLAMTRPEADGFSLSDFSNWAVIKGPLDNVALVEATYLSSTKMATDTSILLDQSALHSEKPLVENATVSDTVIRSTQFDRTFLDYVALDDITNGVEFVDATKHNVATTTDIHCWVASKTTSDTAAVTELAQIATTLPAFENMAVSDSALLSAQFQRDFVDTVVLDDLDNINKNSDATKHNVATLRDVAAIGVTTPYSDSAFIQEAHEYSVGKFFTEYMGTSDVISISIQRPNNLTPVFNGITFNTSTFG